MSPSPEAQVVSSSTSSSSSVGKKPSRLAHLWTVLRDQVLLHVESWRDWKHDRALDEDVDFVADATKEIIEHEARGVRAVIWGCLALVLAFLLWAGLAEIDEVARGEGKVIPASQVQVIQNLDGGIVSELLVREGSIVEMGQVLLRLDPTRFTSNLKESEAQITSLRLKTARLQAVAENTAFVVPDGLQAADAELLAQEQRLYSAKREELDANLQIARQQLTQREQELNEVKANAKQAEQGLALAEKELDLTKPLVKTGAVSDVELLRLEREVNRLRGERNVSAAQIPRLEAAVNESKRKIEEVDLSFRNQVRQELSDTQAKLQALTEGRGALADRVRQTEVRSPVRGTVKQLFTKTIGGVVTPGRDIVEIVPLEDSLLLETRVLPKDIAFIHPGLKARVRFTAYDFSVYGGLDATVEQISADTVTDDKGNSFYIVKVRTQFAYIGSEQRPIIPGMTAEVDILTGRRTILSYLMKPLLRARSSALGEA